MDGYEIACVENIQRIQAKMDRYITPMFAQRGECPQLVDLSNP